MLGKFKANQEDSRCASSIVTENRMDPSDCVDLPSLSHYLSAVAQQANAPRDFSFDMNFYLGADGNAQVHQASESFIGFPHQILLNAVWASKYVDDLVRGCYALHNLKDDAGITARQGVPPSSRRVCHNPSGWKSFR
jgi:hypothetical protein